MYRSQRGITFVGWLFLLVPVALLVYAGIRLTPVYLNYFRIVQTLEQVASENIGSGPVNPVMVRVAIDKRFDIESVNTLTAKDIDIHRQGDQWVAIADYEDVAPFVGNISLLVEFKKTVVLSQ